MCVGNVLNVGSAGVSTRMATFLAGIPETASVHTTNRQCSSGLHAVMAIANSIRSHQIDIGIGGGVESMSTTSMEGAVDPNNLSDKVFEHP